MKESGEIRGAVARVIEALDRVRTGELRRRESLAQLHCKYALLEKRKGTMSKEDLKEFEEIGRLLKSLTET